MNSGRDFLDHKTVLTLFAAACVAGFAALCVLFAAAFFGSSQPQRIAARFREETAPAVPQTAEAEPRRMLTEPPTEPATDIFAAVLRLHILANSDSEDDQAVKLKVRDAVLGLTGELLSDCPDRDTAAVLIEANEGLVLSRVRAVLEAEGKDYGASLVIGMEQYPERDYDGEIYPAGEYLSVRILLGAGEGKNWWCVLFPKLCLAPAVREETTAPETTAAPDETAAVEAGLTPGEYRTAAGTEAAKLRVKFRLLELLRGLFGG